MRVLVLTNMYPYEEDGSFGTFVFEQVRALRSLGVDMDVLFVNGRASRWNYVRGYFQLWRQLRHVQYDLIHAHYVFSGWIARAQRRLPVVVSFHGAGEMVGYQGRLCKVLAPRVDTVIVTSEDHKRRLGFSGAHIIPCGVDLDLFQPEPRDQARAKLGWDQARKTVLWVGDPRKEKRLDLVQGAFALLEQTREDVDLEIVSKLAHDQIPTYMNASDVFVLASDLEGSPVVIKEAMACNLPVVSNAVGDVAEVIGGVQGCYVVQQTCEDLAAKLAMALESGERTQGREAIKHLQTHQEAETIAPIYGRLA